MLNDYYRFARLATGYLGPVILAAGSAPSALPSFFYLSDLPVSAEAPYVPLDDSFDPDLAVDPV